MLSECIHVLSVYRLQLTASVPRSLKTKMERVAISLAAGDATNLELRLLKVVEEVLGKHAKARQPRVKQDERRLRAPFALRRNADCRGAKSFFW